MSGRGLGREYRIATLIHPIGDSQIVQTCRAGDELPETDRPGPTVGPRAETALDQRYVDEILGQPRVTENRPHHPLVTPGALQVDLEIFAAIGLKEVKPALDGVVDRDRYVKARRLGLDLRELTPTEHLPDFGLDLIQPGRVHGLDRHGGWPIEAVWEAGFLGRHRGLLCRHRFRFGFWSRPRRAAGHRQGQQREGR